MMSPVPVPRYRVRAYVCEAGRIAWMPYEGTMTFDEIFRRNPDGCRFAIVEEGIDSILLFDLWMTEWVVDPPPMLRPVNVRSFSDLDAAVAAAQLLY